MNLTADQAERAENLNPMALAESGNQLIAEARHLQTELAPLVRPGGLRCHRASRTARSASRSAP